MHPYTEPHPWVWCAGRAVRVTDVANAPGGQFFPFLDETECDEERVLRVWWDEVGAYARIDREVAFIRIVMSGENVTESGPSNGYYYDVPVQGMAVRIPPGRARVDVRFDNTGPPISDSAMCYGRIDPGRVVYREAIAKGIIDTLSDPILREYDAHSDRNARFATKLRVQTFGVGIVQMTVPSAVIFDLAANTTYYIDARGKITLTPAVPTVGYNCFWEIYE